MSNFIGGNSAAPPGWEREIPKYRVTRDLKPAPKARFRSEPPFSMTWESDVYQYGARPMTTGETIETTDWPHASFRPLNHSAKMVLNFFNSAMKSRLTRSPWHEGRVRLDNGLSDAPMEIDLAIRGGLTPTPRHPGRSTERRAS
jgi:hypothetical protein